MLENIPAQEDGQDNNVDPAVHNYLIDMKIFQIYK